VSQVTMSATQQLRDTLEEEIINGAFQPGQKLDIEALSKRFKVSRTPVREALQQLSSCGLITVIPKRGSFVSQIGLAQLIEMFEVMAELEGMCGRLAARRITQKEMKAMESALAGCETACARGAVDDYYYENAIFHSQIYDSSHNVFLAAEAQQLRYRLKPYRRLQLRVSDRMCRSLDEHREIFNAIKSGDGSKAEFLLKEHVLIQGERFSDLAANVNRLRTQAEEDPASSKSAKAG